jgi:rhomboid protease GluP
MCPQCRAFISSDDKVCPYCNEPVGARSAAVTPANAIESLVPDHSTMTLLFMLVNAGFWIAATIISVNQGNGNAITSLDTRTLILLGAKWRPEMVFGHQWWRLITAGFLHGGAMHIFMNGMSLYYVGRHFEDYFGPARLFVVYIVATVTGFGFSLIMNPYAPSVGASAAIAGLVGALLAASRFPGSPTAGGRKTYGYWTMGLLLLGFLGNLSGQMRTDNAAHIGGWIGGYLVALAAGFPSTPRSPREIFWRAVMGACVGATLLSFWKMYLYFAVLSQTPAYR